MRAAASYCRSVPQIVREEPELSSELNGTRRSWASINDATDVVALLTPNSLDRPWILYEAGVAKGKLGKPVFGVVVGVGFDQATKGPFAQFQNSADDEDSLTKLVLQLIRRNSDAEPREQAVRRQVGAFRESITKLITLKPEEKPAKPGDCGGK
jgi:hypothetical protein